MDNQKKKFDLGQLTATAAVAEMMKEDQAFQRFVALSLGKYMNCDWGDMTEDDKSLNDSAVENNDDRIHGSYVRKLSDGTKQKIWIITEWDRSATTILFPDEY